MYQPTPPGTRGITALRVGLLICMSLSPILVNTALMWVRSDVLQQASALRGGVGTGLGVMTWGTAMGAVTTTAAILAWRRHVSIALSLVIVGAFVCHLLFWPDNYPFLGLAHLLATIAAEAALLYALRTLKRRQT